LAWIEAGLRPDQKRGEVGLGADWKLVLPSPSLYELFQYSCDDHGTNPKTQKPYGRFLGTIFLGRVPTMHVTDHQRLAWPKNPEEWKTTKIKWFLQSAAPPFFCQTGSLRGHF
jgi:hypothetical protein